MTSRQESIPTGDKASHDVADAVDQGTTSSQQVTASTRSRKRRNMTWTRKIELLTSGITGLTAIVALILSLLSTVQLNRRADMSMTMPSVLRFAQGFPTPGNSRIELMVQPTFAVYEKTDLTSVVTSIHLDMTRPPGTNSPTPYFSWYDTLEYDYDVSTGGTNGKVLSDPGPIIVTQDKPQSLMLRFIATQTLLGAGRWGATITAERQNQSPLVVQFCINISPGMISPIAPRGVPNTFGVFILRNDHLSPSVQTPKCYGS